LQLQQLACRVKNSSFYNADLLEMKIDHARNARLVLIHASAATTPRAWLNCARSGAAQTQRLAVDHNNAQFAIALIALARTAIIAGDAYRPYGPYRVRLPLSSARDARVKHRPGAGSAQWSVGREIYA